MKICSKCKIEKDETDFCKDKNTKDKLNVRCRSCVKEYYKENKNEIKEQQSKYRENNEMRLEQQREYYQLNKEKINEKRKEYRKNNREKINERNRNLRKTNENFRLSCVLRGRLGKALKSKTKSAPTMELLGCSINFLMEYLEGTKVEGKDYSDSHIDHIRPCASFDLTDPEQQRECFHYTNLQYLPAQENMSKGVRIL